MYFTAGMLYLNTICLMVLPTLLGRLHPHGAFRTHAPMTSLRNAVIPNTAAIFVFNSAMEAAPLVPCEHQTPILKLQLQAFPTKLSKPSWRPPSLGLRKRNTPIHSTFHFAHQALPNISLHKSSFLFIILLFFFYIFNVNERSKNV